MNKLLFLLLMVFSFLLKAQTQNTKVLVFDIKENIAPSASRITSKAIKRAIEVGADLVIIDMNTYGGYVTDADSIRTTILNCPIPVYVFINNNAASAGALISIACDKIYMREGASIGAATVVNQSGEAAPDKYQSYMRKQMRSTAESQGKDTVISNGDTLIQWKRNPDIAEGMVDQRMIVAGIVDSTKVITFTTEEALKYGYCEGKVSSIEDILRANNIEKYTIEKVEKSALDNLVSFFANPALSSILILLIIGGLYFELQSPGIGFPILVSIVAAVLYFAPLYLDGLAANWEILLFIIGVGLLIVEIFVLPGFGVAGISGLVLMLAGLVLSMVKNVNFDFTLTGTGALTTALTVVFSSFVGLVIFGVIFGRSFLNSRFFNRMVLADTLADSKVHARQELAHPLAQYIDQMAIVKSSLRPSGTVKINNEIIEAKSFGDYIDAGESVIVKAIDGQNLVVQRV